MKFKQRTNPDGGKQLFPFTDRIAVADSFEFKPRQVVLGCDGNLYRMMMHIPNDGTFVYAVSLYKVDGEHKTITNPDFVVYATDEMAAA